MEELVDKIFTIKNDTEISELFSCVRKYLGERNILTNFIEKKLLIDYELYIGGDLEQVEVGIAETEYPEGIEVQRNEGKRRIVEKNGQISHIFIINLLSVKCGEGGIELEDSDLMEIFLILKLILLLISDGVRVTNSSKQDLISFIKKVSNSIGRILDPQCLMVVTTPFNKAEMEKKLYSRLNLVVIPLLELTTSIYFNYQTVTVDTLEAILDLFQQTHAMADRLDKNLLAELNRVVIESSMSIFMKYILLSNNKASSCIVQLILSLVENLIKSENVILRKILEELLIRQLVLIDCLLCEVFLNDKKGKDELSVKEEEYILLGLTIKFLHSTLKLLACSKKLMKQFIDHDFLKDTIESVILTRFLGISFSRIDYSEKSKYNKILSKFTKFNKIKSFNDGECYTKLMISREDFSIEILQKLFVVLPLLFSTSKESSFKLANYLYKHLQIETEVHDSSYFSLLFPLLCETCCVMHADKNTQITLMDEILDLYHAASSSINYLYNNAGTTLFEFLSEHMEFLSIIHISSLTYLLLLDIHFLIEKTSSNSDNVGTLQGHAFKAGKFLSAFLIWCSKYEENYIQYYSAFCITSNINEILIENGFRSDGWILDSVKYLFFIMTQFCLNIGINRKVSYFDGVQDEYSCSNSKDGLLVSFLKGCVLSNKQIYCFICAANIINALCEVQEELVLNYFQSKIDEFNRLLSGISEEVAHNRITNNSTSINFSHIRNIFLFLPFKLFTKIKKNIDSIFKNIFTLASNFGSEPNKGLDIIPNVDLEIFFCSSICSLYFTLTLRSMFNYNISQSDSHSKIHNEEDEGYEGSENTSCTIFKLINNEIDKIDIYFAKILEFYDKQSFFSSQYNDSFSMFITILEYIGSIESKLGFSEKKVQKHAKLFNQKNFTNFYGKMALQKIPYHDILAIIRFGIVNNALNKHSVKYNDIISSAKSLKEPIPRK
ncbi:hypothetical protein HWI79_1769 [Cryptosporidium felis]|nr:hypothetical protein HWI79_1769 [Cryptosporidium felis]